MLADGEKLRSGNGETVEVVGFIGSGGQGEVYRARWNGTEKALKWYFPHLATAEQQKIIEALVGRGNTDQRFLWPEAMVAAKPGGQSFGYLMGLRPTGYASLPQLFRRSVRTSVQALVTASIHLAEAYRHLHSQGIAYRDISWGNVFFNPDTGAVLICDNDNAVFEGQSAGVTGTLEFMAPELVRGESSPRTSSDLHSLAVLLFMILVNHHPLKGRAELEIRCLDAKAQQKLYGTKPVFLFDPSDTSNGPVPGEHDGVVAAWEALPESVRRLFVKAFTGGLHAPAARVRETEWRDALSTTRDLIVLCSSCGRQNMTDPPGTAPDRPCWSCGRVLVRPPQLKIAGRVIMLNRGAGVYPHHLDKATPHDFEHPLAELTEHPQRPGVFGLTNRSSSTWSVRRTDGTTQSVPPGRSMALRLGSSVMINGVGAVVQSSTP